MRCQICENEVQKQWKYCPECGTRLDELLLDHEGYSIERIRDLWTKKGGEGFYENFKAVELVGTLPYAKVKPIRPILGDFTGIHFANIRVFSVLSLQPKYMKELCDIYRLMGYYSADHALRVTKLSKVVDVISKTGLFWKILANKKIQKALSSGWKENHEALIEIVSVDEKKGQIVFRVEEEQLFYLKSAEFLSFIDLNVLGGNLEAMCNMQCIGEEKKDAGKKYFIYKLYLKEEKVEYPVPYLDRAESEKLVDELVEYIVNEKPSGRRKLEDKVHISGEQVEPYFMLKMTEGHKILEKYSGVNCGEKLAKCAGIGSVDEAITFARGIFKQEKAGILHKPKEKGENIILSMDESVYASGVNNIHMKLCMFLAGIIEGILRQSTSGNWVVDETKCKANGDEQCEFTCRVR